MLKITTSIHLYQEGNLEGLNIGELGQYLEEKTHIPFSIPGNVYERFSEKRIEKVANELARIRLKDPEISRLHALFSYRNGKYILEHKSGINPTYVNGVSLPRGKMRVLASGDLIRLSRRTILRFNKKVLEPKP